MALGLREYHRTQLQTVCLTISLPLPTALVGLSIVG